VSTVEQCAYTCRPLFEEAALAHYEQDPGIAGGKYAKSLSTLHECLGLTVPVDPTQALAEVERWFSFFGWWYSARLLERSEPGKAWTELADLVESFGLARAEKLGILADYGREQVDELHGLTMRALELIQGNDFHGAAKYADRAADIQYRLAAERAGTPAPGTSSVGPRREFSG